MTKANSEGSVIRPRRDRTACSRYGPRMCQNYVADACVCVSTTIKVQGVYTVLALLPSKMYCSLFC